MVLRRGMLAVDATIGNGHDTEFLADLVLPGGQVYGMDIQATAIDAARERLAGRADIELHCGCHSDWSWIDSRQRGRVDVCMFNLGYLPGGDHKMITRPDTTLQALDIAADWCRLDGVISAVMYPGHAGGEEETDAVEAWCGRKIKSGWTAERIENPQTVRPGPKAVLLKK